jgi:hypothetical protein
MTPAHESHCHCTDLHQANANKPPLRFFLSSHSQLSVLFPRIKLARSTNPRCQDDNHAVSKMTPPPRPPPPGCKEPTPAPLLPLQACMKCGVLGLSPSWSM